MITLFHVFFDRQYDDTNIKQRQRQKAPNVQQQQLQQQQQRMDTAPMQPKQRQHDMVHVAEQREPPPITKNQPRDNYPKDIPQRDNWYRDDWFSRQDNTWQQGAQRAGGYGQYGGDYRNRRRSPSPERGWEVDVGGGGGYYRYVMIMGFKFTTRVILFLKWHIEHLFYCVNNLITCNVYLQSC